MSRLQIHTFSDLNQKPAPSANSPISYLSFELRKLYPG